METYPSLTFPPVIPMSLGLTVGLSKSLPFFCFFSILILAFLGFWLATPLAVAAAAFLGTMPPFFFLVDIAVVSLRRLDL